LYFSCQSPYFRLVADFHLVPLPSFATRAMWMKSPMPSLGIPVAWFDLEQQPPVVDNADY